MKSHLTSVFFGSASPAVGRAELWSLRTFHRSVPWRRRQSNTPL